MPYLNNYSGSDGEATNTCIEHVTSTAEHRSGCRIPERPNGARKTAPGVEITGPGRKSPTRNPPEYRPPIVDHAWAPTASQNDTLHPLSREIRGPPSLREDHVLSSVKAVPPSSGPGPNWCSCCPRNTVRQWY